MLAFDTFIRLNHARESMLTWHYLNQGKSNFSQVITYKKVMGSLFIIDCYCRIELITLINFAMNTKLLSSREKFLFIIDNWWYVESYFCLLHTDDLINDVDPCFDEETITCINWKTLLTSHDWQECIPAGCIPADHWPYSGVCCSLGGGCLVPEGGWCLVPGGGDGVWSGQVLPPPVNRMNDTQVEKYDLTKTSFRPVIKWSQGLLCLALKKYKLWRRSRFP